VAIEYIASTKKYRVYNENIRDTDYREYDSIDTRIKNEGRLPIALITIK
jgi:hypothetical protein